MDKADDEYSEDELQVLTYLAKCHSMTPSTAKRSEAIVRDFKEKIANVESVIKGLEKRGLVGRAKKGRQGKIHYYASTQILGDLKELGLWSTSRLHKL